MWSTPTGPAADVLVNVSVYVIEPPGWTSLPDAGSEDLTTVSAVTRLVVQSGRCGSAGAQPAGGASPGRTSALRSTSSPRAPSAFTVSAYVTDTSWSGARVPLTV